MSAIILLDGCADNMTKFSYALLTAVIFSSAIPM